MIPVSAVRLPGTKREINNIKNTIHIAGMSPLLHNQYWPLLLCAIGHLPSIATSQSIPMNKNKILSLVTILEYRGASSMTGLVSLQAKLNELSKQRRDTTRDLQTKGKECMSSQQRHRKEKLKQYRTPGI